MTFKTTNVRALNSLLFIKDANSRDFPFIDGNQTVWARPSFIAVSCLPDCDGPTTVTMAAKHEKARKPANLVFDDYLDTPSQKLIVETVTGDAVLQFDTAAQNMRLRIWTNGRRDTDAVFIEIC